MPEDINKNYSATDHKMLENWKDIQKLIALENRLLERLDEIEAKLERLWTAIGN